MPRLGTVATIAMIVLVAMSYLAGTQLAMASEVGIALPSLLWAPAGIGLAAVLVYGPMLAIGVGIGVAVSVLSINGHPAAALGIGLLDSFEVLAAFYALRALGFRYALDRVRDVFALVAVAVIVSVLSVTAATSLLYAVGAIGGDDLGAAWSRWWWAHLSGALIITPLFLTWSVTNRTRQRMPLWCVLELVALFILLLVVGLLVFGSWMPSWLPGARMPYYLVPLLVWAGLRFGPRIAATTNVALSVLAIISIFSGQGPFEELAEFQTFISITAVTTLALAALHVEVTRALRRASAIQQAALDAIVTIDGNDRIVALNPAAERLFAISLHDALGADVKTLFVPENLGRRLHGAKLATYVREQGDELIGKRVRCRARRADGQEFPAEMGVIRTAPDGEDLFSASVRDISTERRVERARRHARAVLEQTVHARTRELRRSEEMLRDAQALAHLGSFDYDLQTGALEWSDEMYRIHGRDPKTFKPSYDEVLASVVPADRAHVAQAIETAIRDSTSFCFENRIVRPDGTLRTLQMQGKVIAGDDGRPARIIGCSQDITERKLAETARYRLVDLVESSQDAIIGLSVDGVVESWNAAAQKMLGYKPEEIVGRRADVLVPAEIHPELEHNLATARCGEDLQPYETVLRRRDGSELEASVTLSAIVDHQKRVIGLSKVLRDISEQKRARRLIEQSLREKEVLLREIHHRVKNNLQVISSLLNLQVTSVSSEMARKGLVESQSRIQSMALLHQLLYQSKDLARIELNTYLRGLVDYLVSTYGEDSDRITASVVAPEVRLDLDRSIPCGLIVNELVTNCFRHAFPGGRRGHIWVELSELDGDQLALEVRDDGVGMPLGVDAENAPTFGLRIARLLAHQLDGTIEIERRGGTRVRTVFPVGQRRESAPDLRAAAVV